MAFQEPLVPRLIPIRSRSHELTVGPSVQILSSKRVQARTCRPIFVDGIIVDWIAIVWNPTAGAPASLTTSPACA
jgi:hypothetical protein